MENIDKITNMIGSSITRLSEVNYLLNNIALQYAKDGDTEMYDKFNKISETIGMTICTLSRQKERLW